MPRRLKRKRKPKGKHELKTHAANRLRRRYGLSDAEQAAEDITRMIRRHEATFLWRESSTRTHWLAHYQNQDIIVVYYKPGSFICTALPKDAIFSYATEDLQVLRGQDQAPVIRD